MTPQAPEVLLSDYKTDEITQEIPPTRPFQTQLVWKNIIGFMLLHYWAAQTFAHWQWTQFWFHFLYGFIASFGIASGSHRLWAHRSYKANKKLRILLMIFQTISAQNDTIEWVRDHRVHHKFSDTDADPSNSKRGSFFSHIGWLMCKKHPDVKKFGAKVDMSDVENDPILKFQRRFYLPLVLLLSFALPVCISAYLVKPAISPYIAFCGVCFRYLVTLHITWLTNSVAHIGTWKPYDKNIAASDSKLNGTLTYGEGWHNFHHTFPFDYKVSELPLYRHNFGMAFIDFFAWLGWATDLKTASDEMVRKRVLRTGDGTHPYCVAAAKMMKKFGADTNNNNGVEGNEGSEVYWGLGDKDIPDCEIRDIATLCKKHDS